MALEWWTYEAGGAKLGISGPAFRQKAIRARWTRRPGDGGRAEVWVDVEELKAAMPLHRQRSKLDGQPSDASSTPEQPAVDHSAEARTFKALNANIETLTGMLAGARQDSERERKRADGGWGRSNELADEMSRLQAELASRERDHAADIAAMSRRFAEEVSETRADATVQREVVEIARAETQRMKAEVNSAEQARKEQVRAEHDRWEALPWLLRRMIPEPPRIDMFGHVSVRLSNRAKRIA